MLSPLKIITFENVILDAPFKDYCVSWKSHVLFLRYLLYISPSILEVGDVILSINIGYRVHF